MAFLIPVLVVFVAVLSVQSDAQQNGGDVIDVLEVVSVFKEAVAIYSTINDPNQKCLKVVREGFDYENKIANFTWYYQGVGDSPKTRCFYNLMDGTDPAIFYIAQCDDTSNLEEARELYSDGKTCFVGQFPQMTGDRERLLTYHALIEGGRERDLLLAEWVTVIASRKKKEKRPSALSVHLTDTFFKREMLLALIVGDLEATLSQKAETVIRALKQEHPDSETRSSWHQNEIIQTSSQMFEDCGLWPPALCA